MRVPVITRLRAAPRALRRGFALAIAWFPLTPKGILLLGLAALSLLLFGLKRIDLLLLVVGAVGLAVGALALLVVVVTAVALAIALRVRAASASPAPNAVAPSGGALLLVTGIPARSDFSLPSLGGVPLVRLAWRWETPRARVTTTREAGRLVEHVAAERRALGETLTRRIDVGDVFGIAKITLRQTEVRPLRVVPSVGALRHVPVVRALSGGDDFYDPLGAPQGDPLDMRAYAPGDPVRLILWKVYARSRQLVVRAPERAKSPTQKTVAYLVVGPGDEAPAGALRAAVQNGALGKSWLLGADGVRSDATTPDAAEELLARSGNADERDGGQGLAAFLRRARAEMGGAAHGVRAVLFVPARPGAWMARVVSAVRAHPAAQGRPGIEILVCTDGFTLGAPPSMLSRVLLRPQPIEPARAAQRELYQVIDALAAAHVPIALVDRVAGKVYRDAFRRSLGRKAPNGESEPHRPTQTDGVARAHAGAAP